MDSEVDPIRAGSDSDVHPVRQCDFALLEQRSLFGDLSRYDRDGCPTIHEGGTAFGDPCVVRGVDGDVNKWGGRLLLLIIAIANSRHGLTTCGDTRR